MAGAERLFEDNLQLGRAEYLLQRVHLRARPRILGLVLGNRCNLNCIHCYQAKNADSLLAPPEIGRELRRELCGLYPYLSTLDLLGGEAFLNPGFWDLVSDVTATVRRPILRLTTNGTLLDDRAAERLVRAPFHSVTISIDGATHATYQRLRQGGDLDTVLAGIRRIQQWKAHLASEFPVLDSFFVVMRSNFREIPAYLDLLHTEGVREVALETIRINHQNTARTPTLVEDEVIRDPGDVAALHRLLMDVLPAHRPHFRAIRLSGLSTLFNAHGLDAGFLDEKSAGLYPESDNMRSATGSLDLCPNPWTTLFVTETGNVHLCFLSEPIGNLYETPLAEIWNSPAALAKRSRMISGRYLDAACSGPSCSWREGLKPPALAPADFDSLLAEVKVLSERAAQLTPAEHPDRPAITAVRRLLAERSQSVAEWETLFRQLCETNGRLHEQGRLYIDQLEAELAQTHQALRRAQTEQRWPLVRIARGISKILRRLAGRH